MPATARKTGLADNRVVDELPTPGQSDQSLQPHSILNNVVVVDDSRIDRALHSRALSRSGAIGQMIDFADAQTALECLQQDTGTRPDAIFLDVNMPGMDAFDFLKAATSALGADFTSAVVILTSIPLLPRELDRLTTFDVVRYFMEKPLRESDIRSLAAELGSKFATSDQSAAYATSPL